MSISPSPRSRPRRLSAPSAAVLAFGGVIGWSAFLLFSVEPLIGRLVLPVFGGTPAVWATTLFFFQAVLLLGYLYGHLSVTRLGLRRGAIVHVVLILGAAASLLVAPARAADLRNPAIPDVLNLIGMLGLTIGLPGVRPDDDDPARVCVVCRESRLAPTAGRLLAVRPEQRRLPAGPVGLSVHRRAAARAVGAARRLGGRLRAVRHRDRRLRSLGQPPRSGFR